MQKCKQCGTEYEDEASYCNICEINLNESNDDKGSLVVSDVNQSMVIIGVILIIAAIAALIATGSMYEDLNGMKANADIAKDIIRYGGLGAGAIGLVLLLVGLLKQSSK